MPSNENAVLTRELSDEIAKRSKLSKGLARDLLKITFEAISDFLKSNRDVKIVNFGTFTLKHMGPRVSLNSDLILGQDEYKIIFRANKKIAQDELNTENSDIKL